MQKRFMPVVYRQIALLCRRNTNQYLICKNQKSMLTIPKITLLKETNFHESIKQYLSSFDLLFDIKGIAKINIGNDGLHNFYRWTYFVQLDKQQEIKNEKLFYLKYQKQIAESIELQVRKLMQQISQSNKICSSDLFRENFKQEKPRNTSVKTVIDI